MKLDYLWELRSCCANKQFSWRTNLKLLQWMEHSWKKTHRECFGFLVRIFCIKTNSDKKNEQMQISPMFASSRWSCLHVHLTRAILQISTISYWTGSNIISSAFLTKASRHYTVQRTNIIPKLCETKRVPRGTCNSEVFLMTSIKLVLTSVIVHVGTFSSSRVFPNLTCLSISWQRRCVRSCIVHTSIVR